MKNIRTYILGLALSLTLTIAAFGLVEFHLGSAHEFPSHLASVAILTALALIQLLVQLALFLHVGREEKPRFNLMALSFALITVVILVGGTLWIMQNLMHLGHLTQPNVFQEENIYPNGHPR